ncbi:Helix-turn-helix domain-containing protein [Salegentibacter holothuriorum]|uniref:Helix-turn-helix domain-containing protein n=1 Tax=Salegentibacter holothuriorum TaxID=241145 RepID=A0A1T5BPE3_9FLAO|nr:helix-turn-helix domain-containing protein [Salegentibacter holothuriorum]SKB48959.1 Helix-turn-helix domain-containing protein [Salegentibacter holothuriorum]
MENLGFVQAITEDFKKDLLEKIKQELDHFREEFRCKETQELLTRQEVASLFKINISTLHNWCKSGYLKKYALGNRIYFRRSEIEASLIKI